MYLADLLRAQGYGVQLELDTTKPHYVQLIVGGKVITSHPDLQANYRFQQKDAFSREMVAELNEQI